MESNLIRILAIEDNPGDALLLAQELSEIQSQIFQLTQAETLADAFKFAKESSFEVAFLDLDLPDSKGLQTLERFRELLPHLPVIVLTSKGEETLGLRAVRMGAADYIVKGHFDEQLLSRSVSYSIERHRILGKLQEFEAALFAAATHELRTPLTIIQENLSLVLDRVTGPVSSEQAGCLKMAMRNCGRLGTLLNDLADMSMLNSNTDNRVPEITNIGSLLEESHASFLPECKLKNLRMELEAPAYLPLVLCDPEKIRQALANVVGNAVKFTPPGGVISIRAEANPTSVSIEVIDSGIGISAEDQRSIFKAFTQINREEGPGARGTGLGLAIAKRILELHGGQIAVKSELGLGSCFRLTVPLQPSTAGVVIAA